MAELIEVQTPASHAPDRRAHVATAMLLLATVAWGFGFTWAKAAQTAINMQSTLPSDASFGPMFVLAARFILAGAILLVVLPAARRGWSVRGIGYATVLGGMLGAGMLLQHLGLARTSEAVTAFLTSLTILFVPILMLALNRPPARLFWAAVVLATIGVWLMTGATPSGFGWGEVFGVGCAVVFSVYIFATNAIVPRDDAWRMTAGMFLVAGLFTLATCALVPHPSLTRAMRALGSASTAANFLLILLFPTLFSYAVMNLYQPHLDPTRAALIYLMEPIFAAAYAWVARGATLSITAIFGAALILTANALVEFLSSRRRA
jgi:drug/metabolite transporter (DMT)-like permease